MSLNQPESVQDILPEKTLISSECSWFALTWLSLPEKYIFPVVKAQWTHQ